MNIEERLDSLEKQFKELSLKNNRLQFASHLMKKYDIDDENDILLEVAISHLGVDATIETAEQEYENVCKRAGVNLKNPINSYIEKKAKKEIDNAHYAEELEFAK